MKLPFEVLNMAKVVLQVLRALTRYLCLVRDRLLGALLSIRPHIRLLLHLLVVFREIFANEFFTRFLQSIERMSCHLSHVAANRLILLGL